MTNKEIAGILNEISILLTIKGVNPFKIRAYERAVRIVKDFPDPIEDLVNNNQLLSIEGIGKGLEETITEIVNTGKSSSIDELLQEFPESILEIVEIPGLGPKKVAFIYNEVGISSLEDLERAARGGILADYKGFGKKTQENIIKGIELRKHALENRSIGFALPLAREIISALKDTGRIIDISEVGTVRRRCETVKSLDIICSTEYHRIIINKFTGLPLVKKVIMMQKDSAAIRVEQDFRVRLFTVNPPDFIPILFLMTGAKEHVNAVMPLLEENGYKLERNGILRDMDDERATVFTENELYEKAKLPYIPPGIRETGKEVALCKSGNCPTLIDRNDIKGDMQMHSTYSDGSASIREMAEKAMEMGYSYIAMTDHSKSLHIANGLDKDKLKVQHKQIDKLNEEFAGKFRIFKGAEVDILSDGTLDYDDEILNTLDFVLAAIHIGTKMSKEKMTERVLKAINHPKVHCLAHPSGRLIGRRHEFEMDWDKIFHAAKKAGIAIEINAHPSRLDLNEERARRARDMGIPIIINTDAHSPDQLELVEYGIYVARRGWLEKGDVLNAGTVEEMEEWLQDQSNDCTNCRDDD